MTANEKIALFMGRKDVPNYDKEPALFQETWNEVVRKFCAVPEGWFELIGEHHAYRIAFNSAFTGLSFIFEYGTRIASLIKMMEFFNSHGESHAVAIEHFTLRSKMENVDGGGLTLSQLRRIVEIIDEEKP